MYCVKCGRQAQNNEKRCPDCGTRLVTPAKLKSLIELEKYVNMTFSGKVRNLLKRLHKRTKKKIKAVKQSISIFWGKLKIDLKALFVILYKAAKYSAIKIGAFLKRLIGVITEYTKLILSELWRLSKAIYKKAKLKAKELRQQYAIERENQISRRNVSATGNVSRQSAIIANERIIKQDKHTAATKTRNERAMSLSEYRSVSAAKRKTQNTKSQRASSKPDRTKLPYANRTGVKKSSTKRTNASRKKLFTKKWAEEHLRSIIAMGLLAAALLIFVFWGEFSDSGQKTFAKIGLGSARGYMLIGDDYMNDKNYTRAVEYYYSSITKDLTYETALKLAIAYSYTGDISKEVSALLLCAEHYPENKLPFSQLYVLYPDETNRPARVKQAIENGFRIYGSL